MNRGGFVEGATGKMQRMSTGPKLLMWMNVVAFVAMIGVNAAANLIPLGGHTTGEVSAAYPTLFTPAPVTFVIWGAIYVLMAVYVIYQLGMGKACFDGAAMRRDVSWWFVLSCAMNVGWILCWHFDLLVLSLVFILLLLVCLAKMASRVDLRMEQQILGKLSVIGMQLYMGWIVAATIANASVVLVSLGWNGLDNTAEFWTVLMLVAATLLGVMLAVASDTPIATLAVVWAFAGIVSRHAGATGFDMQYPMVVIAAILGMMIMLISAALDVSLFRRGRSTMESWK